VRSTGGSPYISAAGVNQKLRKAIETEGRIARIEGLWWRFSLTARGPREPSAVSLLRITRDRDGALELSGRSWQGDGSLSARYWSEATKERKEPSGVESPDRASGYFTTRADNDPDVHARTAGVFWRAEPDDMRVMDGPDDGQRASLISERLGRWKALTNA
jgi:hypothetical protein